MALRRPVSCAAKRRLVALASFNACADSHVINDSAKLAVLAAAPVETRRRTLISITGFLAVHAKANARHSLAPCFRNTGFTLFAALQTGTLAQLGARTLDAILDGGIDLVLDGTVACPTRCHDDLLEFCLLPDDQE
jgi:hypothetical protein